MGKAGIPMYIGTLRDFTRRHRVVTADGEWMTAAQAIRGQPSSAEETVASQGLNGVVAARRAVLAGPDQKRADHSLISEDE